MPVLEVISNLCIIASTNGTRIFCYMFEIQHGFNRRNEKSGLKRKFYDRWQNMKTRCFNPHRKDWPSYGGRGITVVVEWLDFMTFQDDMYKSFIIHVSKHGLKNTTLDRIDTNGDYCRANCKWATKSEQGATMRKVKSVTFKGEKYRIAELVKLYNRPYMTIYSRLTRGIPLDKPYRRPRVSNNQ